eukprot:11088081-Ditylum_brightwellii.AAC.1
MISTHEGQCPQTTKAVFEMDQMSFMIPVSTTVSKSLKSVSLLAKTQLFPGPTAQPLPLGPTY